jgi:glycosyltransferase involved in cell wall biosynthesis
MDLRSRRQALGMGLVVAAVIAIVLANAVTGARGDVAAGWWVAAGFAAGAAGLGLLELPLEAGVLSLVLALYVGVSGALAAMLPARDVSDSRSAFAPLAKLPFIRLATTGPRLASWAFHPTLALASACGMLCIAALVLVASLPGRPARSAAPLEHQRLLQASSLLVAAGLVGAALAAAHYAISHQGPALSTSALQSFWKGGAYFTLLAQFAIPGLGLRLSLLVERGAGRRAIASTATGLVLFLLLTVPTEERGFLIEGGLIVVAILLMFRPRFRLLLVPAVIAGLLLLVVTQAARDAVRIDGTASPAAVARYLAPDQWTRTLENQFASFQWAADVHAYASALHGTNPLVALLVKPVPRQLWPGKPSGLGAELTATVYPTASAAGVNFAVPLYAELQFALGAAGALIGLALLGALLAAGLRTALSWPRPVQPVARVLFLWAGFLLIRGDLSDSVPVAVAALLPLVVIAWWSRVKPPRTLILDALAVPPAYSGVGETVRRIGRELTGSGSGPPLALPASLVVRCPADMRDTLATSFPAGTAFHTPIPSSRPAWRRLAHQLVLCPLRDGRAAVVVHTSEIGSWWGRPWRALVVHDLRRRTAPDTARGSERRLYGALVPPAVAGADAILTVSQATATSLRAELHPRAQITVVAPHSGLVIRRCGPARAGRDLIVVGAVRPYKGAELVLAALAALAPGARPRVRWAGALEVPSATGGELRRRGGELGVEFLGWLDEQRLEAALDAAGGLLAPSAFEGYGLSLLEGLRRGMPVLASEIPSHREIAAAAALYFDPGQPAELARLLAEFEAGAIDLAAQGELSLERALALSAATPSWGQALGELCIRLQAAGAPSAPP